MKIDTQKLYYENLAGQIANFLQHYNDEDFSIRLKSHEIAQLHELHVSLLKLVAPRFMHSYNTCSACGKDCDYLKSKRKDIEDIVLGVIQEENYKSDEDKDKFLILAGCQIIRQIRGE